jgi:formate dehydrogenase maturation protein FdhE
MKLRGPAPEAKPTPHHPDELKPGAHLVSSEKIDAAFTGWRDVEYVSLDLLRATADVLRMQHSFLELFRQGARRYNLSAPEAAARLADGRPLLEAERLKVEPAALVQLVAALPALYSLYAQPVREEAAAWFAKLTAEPEKLPAWVALNLGRDAVKINAAREAQGVSIEVFTTFFYQIASTVLSAYAAELGGLVDDEKWLRKSCPICGNQPTLAGLAGDGGHRHLLCGTCDFVWTFPRIRCCFCDNDDQDSLKVLSPADQSPYRLESCEKCRRYLKTIDYRLIDGKHVVVPGLEDAATLYLDLAAEKEKLNR